MIVLYRTVATAHYPSKSRSCFYALIGECEVRLCLCFAGRENCAHTLYCRCSNRVTRQCRGLSTSVRSVFRVPEVALLTNVPAVSVIGQVTTNDLPSLVDQCFLGNTAYSSLVEIECLGIKRHQLQTLKVSYTRHRDKKLLVQHIIHLVPSKTVKI